MVRLGGQIACVPFAADAELVGETATFSSSGSDLVLATRLLQAALTRVLATGWNFPLRKLAPPTFVSRLPGRDLLEKALADRGEIRGLHVYPEYLLDVRRSGPVEYPGIIVGIKTRYEIEIPVSVLVQHDVPVAGRYVLTTSDSVPESPFQDPVARRRLRGIIEAVAGDELRLGTEEGAMTVKASEAWLEAHRDNFLDVLQAIAGTSYTRIIAALEAEAFKVTGAEGRMARTEEIADGLIRHSPLMIARGVHAESARQREAKAPLAG